MTPGEVTGRFRAGCSGWQYKHWKGSFYPATLPQSRWLHHYAGVFDTVELNNSFYRLPEPERFASWREETPPGFLFAVKASRHLTHMKKLKDPEEPLERLFSRAKALGAKLGPVLYQLPPRWKYDPERLDQFLHALPKRRRHVIEFREPGWYREEVFSALEERRVALCLHDMRGSESPRRAIGPSSMSAFTARARNTGVVTPTSSYRNGPPGFAGAWQRSGTCLRTSTTIGGAMRRGMLRG